MKLSNCGHKPELTQGAIGMYHCPECGEMVLAGVIHCGELEESDFEELVRLEGKLNA